MIININIENVKGSFNKVVFSNCKKLAKEMGYEYKEDASKKNKVNNEIKDSNDKKKDYAEFRIPYSDFEREIFVCAFEKLNSRANKLEKEKDSFKKEKEGLEKEVLSKKNEIKDLKDDKQKYEKNINDLKLEIKDSKDNNERLIEEISKFKSENLTNKISLDDANKKLAENKKLINRLVYKIKRDESGYEKLKKIFGVVIYNIWRLSRTIERDYEFNKQNLESINNLIDIFGKNLENFGDGFEDNEVDLEFLVNQKLLINESLKSLEKSHRQYNRISILLENSGIRIEEYDDIKDEDKLNVYKLDVSESSEVQEIIVETVKPSIYYDDKRIFEGEVIITKPKE